MGNKKIKHGWHWLLLAAGGLLMAVGGFTPQSASSQQSASAPQLVVSIVVDQLRGDYLNYFLPSLGEKGFKRLMNEGLVYRSVDFGIPHKSEASSVASIYTGTYPSENGITGDTRYDWTTNHVVPIVTDSKFLGNYTSDRFSPMPLLASTIGDELRQATGGKSKVFAIAPNAAAAIVSGGRNATCALWLDESNGQWATSTYYRDFPNYIDRYNAKDAPANFPEKMWQQSHSNYAGFPYTQRTSPFLYTFEKSEKGNFRRFKQSALVNMEVTKLATYMIDQAPFRAVDAPDFFAITYYAGNYKYGKEAEEYSVEVQDIYYRLDAELEKLLEHLDKRVGLKNVLIVLSSTGYYDELNRTPAAGEFYPERCIALLNMYLMAVYGEGNWVAACHDHQIYLNPKLVEEKKLNRQELLQNAADFVEQFSGVQSCAITTQMPNAIGIHKKVSGDLSIELQPGWLEMDAPNKPQAHSRNNNTLAPLIIWGNRIRHKQISRTIKVTEIAPTVSSILHICAPNACEELPLQEIL
ncbi:alkaline phosphatase [Bacteroidia bacterium]|nr:alkaline phosphatase [Bacteroidia bacterium]